MKHAVQDFRGAVAEMEKNCWLAAADTMMKPLESGVVPLEISGAAKMTTLEKRVLSVFGPE
ncbi:MAG: hypothetical protein ACLU9R_07495 [Faecalibacterium sp.]